MNAHQKKTLRLLSGSVLVTVCLVLGGCASFPDDFNDVKQDFTHPKGRLIQNLPVRSVPMDSVVFG
jgi:starvation-inducible outer membrane lipoprotein